MSQGTMSIYEYLHKKALSKQIQTNEIKASKDCNNDNEFGCNGIEFRKCRMMLAIQNESQLKHSKKFYPEEDESLLNDLGN